MMEVTVTKEMYLLALKIVNHYEFKHKEQFNRNTDYDITKLSTGDYVKCEKTTGTYYTPGKLYKLIDVKQTSLNPFWKEEIKDWHAVINDDNNKKKTIRRTAFRLFSCPSKEEVENEVR